MRTAVALAVLLVAACTGTAAPPAGTADAGQAETTTAATVREPTASTSGPASVRPGLLPLAGRTVVLDAGHNGGNAAQAARAAAPVPAGGFTKPCNTPGTATSGGYPEHAFTYDVVQRAAALLTAEGAKVVQTRASDSGFGPCVDQRAAVGTAVRADAAVSVHADGGPAAGYGFHVIYPELAPDRGNAVILAPSRALALAVRASFRAQSAEPYSTYTGQQGLDRRSDLAGLNLSRVPAIFLECGNMRNAGDAARLQSPQWRQQAALGVATGVTAFLRG